MNRKTPIPHQTSTNEPQKVLNWLLTEVNHVQAQGGSVDDLINRLAEISHQLSSKISKLQPMVQKDEKHEFDGDIEVQNEPESSSEFHSTTKRGKYRKRVKKI